MRTAVFITEPGVPGYTAAAETWVENTPNAFIFHTGKENPSTRHHHLLSFLKHNSEQQFGRILYILDGNPSSAQLFPFILRYPGLMALESCSLGEMVENISFSRNDPHGTGAVLRTAGLLDHPGNSRLQRIGIDTSNIDGEIRLAAALCRLSTAVIVPEFDMAAALEKQTGGSLSVITMQAADFAAQLVACFDSAAESSLKPEDLFGVYPDPRNRQKQLVLGQVFPRHQHLCQPILVAFQDIFDTIERQRQPRSERP